ncbi:MAG: ABC transporter ATP-binding protein [Planctomycetales bacterium]|nr:ABC transporter ATP-binding protein [Planctomycetales bacterium]
MAVGVQCRDVSKRFGAARVLNGVDWTARAGVVSGLVGVSAAGKTSLLRIIAGLDRADSGTVEFPRDEVSQTEAAKAQSPRIGMTFQNLSLWPHLTARQHVASVLRVAARDGAVEALLAEVGLPASTFDRRPAELSGGEGQRLALARALAVKPELLLLDEPLAQLDTPWRDELLSVIQTAALRHATTTIYVSHAWREVAAICDDVAVLVDGRVAQAGSTDEVFKSPANETVARLTGPVVGLPRAAINAGQVSLVGNLPVSSGESIFVRPQQVRLVEPTEANRWRVAEARPLDVGWQVTLEQVDASVANLSGVPASKAASDSGFRIGIRSPQHAPVGNLVGLAIVDWERVLQFGERSIL